MSSFVRGRLVEHTGLFRTASGSLRRSLSQTRESSQPRTANNNNQQQQLHNVSTSDQPVNPTASTPIQHSTTPQHNISQHQSIQRSNTLNNNTHTSNSSNNNNNNNPLAINSLPSLFSYKALLRYNACYSSRLKRQSQLPQRLRHQQQQPNNNNNNTHHTSNTSILKLNPQQTTKYKYSFRRTQSFQNRYLRPLHTFGDKNVLLQEQSNINNKLNNHFNTITHHTTQQPSYINRIISRDLRPPRHLPRHQRIIINPNVLRRIYGPRSRWNILKYYHTLIKKHHHKSHKQHIKQQQQIPQNIRYDKNQRFINLGITSSLPPPSEAIYAKKHPWNFQHKINLLCQTMKPFKIIHNAIQHAIKLQLHVNQSRQISTKINIGNNNKILKNKIKTNLKKIDMNNNNNNNNNNILQKQNKKIKSPHEIAQRHYRRRYFRDPAQTHNYAGIAQGFGYATRLEEKFQPGSTHVVSALPVFEHHEYREPILLRYRFHFIRAWRRLTDRPFKMYLWLLLSIPVGYAYLFCSTSWDLATRVRRLAKEHLALAGLAMQSRQLRLMIIEDLIEFQNNEAKHAFIGVLDGIDEELRKELNENQILIQLDKLVMYSFIQPLNEMLKPKKQKIFFEYANLQTYSRAVDNIHNRTAVTLDETSLYRLTNQHRERRYFARWSTGSGTHSRFLGVMPKKHRYRKFYRQRRTRFKRPATGRFALKYGPLLRSFDNLPPYHFWGGLVGLTDLMWLRDTRHPTLGPIAGKLFSIQEANAYTNPQENEAQAWYNPYWRRLGGYVSDTHWIDGKIIPFVQDRTRDRSTNRIRDADALLREMERYVVQGDYVRIRNDRFDDPHDPLLNKIPEYVLNSSDKTMSGPLWSYLTTKLSSQDPISWSMYRRFIISEFVILQKLHQWMREAVFVQLGQSIPAANVQGYLKFYDESYLPFPEHDRQKGDLDWLIGDEGGWDEVIQLAMRSEAEINRQAKEQWLKMGEPEEKFVPSTKIVDSVLALVPLRGNYANHNAEDVKWWHSLKENQWDSQYYRGKKHRARTWGEWDDPQTKQLVEYADRARSDDFEDPVAAGGIPAGQRLRGKYDPKDGYAINTHGAKWDNIALREIEQNMRYGAQVPNGALPGANNNNNLNFQQQTGGQLSEPDQWTRPIARPVPADQFIPAEPDLPWPKGFFNDNPPLNDPFYYTRKYGLGTRKDWDRMVRLGAWEDVEHIEDSVAGITGHIPRIWDPDGIDSEQLPTYIHQRTYKKLLKKSEEQPNTENGWNHKELFWLNVVYNKLARARRHHVFPLIPAPHERLWEAKQNHASTFSIDCGAETDLYTSNQYNGDWILFSTMPTIYPVPPPLHELTFITTMVSRIEGCIMQHAAELDLSALKIRELMLERAEDETRGLLIPDLSPELQQDDELQAILNHRPEALQIQRISRANEIADGNAMGQFNEYGERIKYSERYNKYQFLNPNYTNRQAILHNLYDIFEITMDTLTGRGIFWETEETKKRRRLKHRINTSINHSGLRVRDVASADPRLKWYFSRQSGGFIPGLYLKQVINGEYEMSKVPQPYISKMTAQEWIMNMRNTELFERVVTHLFRQRIQRFRADLRLVRYEEERFKSFLEANAHKPNRHFIDKAGNHLKKYDARLEPVVDLFEMGDIILNNLTKAYQRMDPIDRTKDWSMYQATDADPEFTGVDPKTGKPIQQFKWAKDILENKKFQQLVEEKNWAKAMNSGKEKPLMKMREEMFHREFGNVNENKIKMDDHFSHQDVANLNPNSKEYYEIRAKNVKAQVEATVTLDNLEQVKRIQHLRDRALGAGRKEPDATYELFNPDRFVRYKNVPGPLASRKVRKQFEKNKRKRTAGYEPKPVFFKRFDEYFPQ